MTSEIKTDENTSEVLDQDQTDGISSVISKNAQCGFISAVHLRSNGQELTVTISIDAFHQSR